MANRLGLETDAVGNYNQKHNAREKKLAETIREDKNINDTFRQQVVVSVSNGDGAGTRVTEAAAGMEIGIASGAAMYEQHLAVVESTGTAEYLHPYTSSDGLELPLDADVLNGPTAYELTNGITSRSKAAFTIGTDDPFYLEAVIKIDDISDLEEMWVGFRKAAAYTADPDDYTDVAAFHVGETGGTVADGQINLATILNNAATTYTDTTLTDWADAGQHTLRIDVTKAGKVTFSYDDAAPTVTASFTFDDGDVVIPFLYVDNTTGSTTGDPGVTLVSWKVGKR